MMNISVLLALAGAAFNTGNDLLYRKVSLISRNTGPLPFYLMSSAASAVTAFCLIMLKSSRVRNMHFGTPDIVYGVILGVLSFVAYILYLMSFNGKNTSISVTIYRMNLIPGILLAVIFMGELISLRRGTAILSCILSVILLGSWGIGRFQDKRYLLLSICACMSGGVLNVVNKAAVTNGGNSFNLLFIRFTIVALLTGVFVLVRKTWTFDVKIIKYAILSGLALMFAIYFVLEALKTGDVGLVLPVTQLSFTLVAIASWLLFKEEVNAKKLFGVVLAIGSVLLMN
jgi:uncharacterized membrane protein